ncbi:MAG: hypothetical protein B6I18_02050 [Bacteroidetes bacterium 4572_112]|nr:MAG: hypothetical protein B6I18_02050 [Bacteroidetes bacterium 4572_112]
MLILILKKYNILNSVKSLINIFIFLVLFSYFNVSAQSENEEIDKVINQQIWLDFYSHYKINDKIEYYGDFGYRTIITKQSWNRIYIRPSIKYIISKSWELHTGIGLFYIFDKYDYNTLEISPWQGVQFNWPIGKRISFKHLAKIEERFNYVTDDWTYSLEFRFRYKLSTQIKLKGKLYIPAYLEYFLPMPLDKTKEIYQNKGRAGAGLGYSFLNDLKIAFLFNWQTSRSGANEDLNISDFAYQIKIIKVWNGKYLFNKEPENDTYY